MELFRVMKNNVIIAGFLILLLSFGFAGSCTGQSETALDMNNIYPWCVVAFDSLERSPEERIRMLKEMGFNKYAYDWEKEYLDDTKRELELAKKNNLEIVAGWLWLNAKRDSIGKLSARNKRFFEILKQTKLETTLWVSFNNNFFKDLPEERALDKAIDMIQFIYNEAESVGCGIELYNHGGWFGDLNNQIKIIEALPQCSLRIVYNFHHGHQDIDEFAQIIKKIVPHLSSVNLNGMRKEGPKILPIGEGNYEKKMIEILVAEGFKGPWGILGHVKNEDVKQVLERNISGFKSLGISFN